MNENRGIRSIPIAFTRFIVISLLPLWNILFIEMFHYSIRKVVFVNGISRGEKA
jgi:hypothetical protein